MKIAIIGTTSADMIGFRGDLIKMLVKEGHEVYTFAVDYDVNKRKKLEELGAITVDYQLSRAGLNPISDIYNTYKLSRTLQKIKPDLVFSYSDKPVIFGTLAAALAGVKRRIGMLEGLGYAFTDHPNGMTNQSIMVRKIQILLYRIAFPFLERLIFLNLDDPVDLLEKNNLHVKEICVLGGIGLNLMDYPYSTPNISPISFIFIARLLAEKGVYDYIAAARLVKSKYPHANFIILGRLDEDNPGGLTAQALKNLVDEGVVIYPGYVSNVHEWLANSSVFVLPSYYREGVPRSTQEAMAIGRPIITTDGPGCRETVIDGKNGFLVPRWSPEILAEKMAFFIEKPEKIQTMGIESRKIAQDKFDGNIVNLRLLNYLGLEVM